MTTNSHSSPIQGFSVSQPTLTSPLQFYPALGTPELDMLINCYVPGPASIQEKRALVSMDFFHHAQMTGESFRYYPVCVATSSGTSSPAQGSASGSSFVSPALSHGSWSHSETVHTPASSFSMEPAVAKPARKTTSSSTRSSPTDFASLPGMKIMTRDGRDVTNSASRGCKTKEQRDHAHLMRIIKACDACKKKKIRCDPSHKKRSAAATPASQTPAQPTARTKASSKKRKQPTPEVLMPSKPASIPAFTQDALFADLDLDLDLSHMDSLVDDSWDAFIHYDDDVMDAAPADYDFFLDPAGYFSSDTSTSASPASASAPAAVVAPQALSAQATQPQAMSSHAPALPYMATGLPGTDYVDFNLFSPATSFVDDDSLPAFDAGTAVPTAAPAPLHDSTLLEEQPFENTTVGGRVQHIAVGGQNIERQQFVRRRERVEDLGGWDEPGPRALAGGDVAHNTAVANVHSQAYYAPLPRQEREELSRGAAMRAPRVDDSPATSTGVVSSSRADPQNDGSDHGLIPASTPVSGSGSHAQAVPHDSPGTMAVMPATPAPNAPGASAARAAVPGQPSTGRRVQTPPGPGAVARMASSPTIATEPHKTIAWFDPGVVVNGAQAILARSPAEKWVTVYAGREAHDVTALVVLGVTASMLRGSLAAWSLIQLVLGFMVLGALVSPKSTWRNAPEQRIRGTNPLPSTNHDDRQGPLDLARSNAASWKSRPTAHRSCRQTINAHCVSAVGRLATLELPALTQ